MAFTVKVPQEYKVETEYSKHKVINVKQKDGSVWVCWVEFEEDAVIIKSKDLTSGDDPDSVQLFKEDYEKLIGKK